ncbi:hypothetical protein [Vannielia litorea]|uniref:hypothetical protein n=1 Tax=Vannielia litorea TaxID=1217970 RepID=UPI001C98E42E|nr:hypothetical protein [Vannielia litorea]MBY6048854.1 hypothetical protein [Vannielia litorea]MBY6076268.1 hypothetical protein [Vannielia litorea]
MTLRLWLHAVALVAAFVAAPLRAETVRLLSGEHNGFTRIALVLARESAWRVGRIEGGFGLELARRDIAVDLTEAFDLIPRTRIGTLKFDAAEGLLSIGVRCNCHADAFQIRSNILVVDIRDGPAPEGNAFNAPLNPPDPAPEKAPEPVHPPTAEVADGVLPPLHAGALRKRYDRPVVLPNRQSAPPESPPESVPAREEPPVTDAFAEARERRRIAEIEAELLKQLARAGSQGMVKPNPAYAGLEGQVAQPDAVMPPSNHPGANVDAITGVDRAAPDAPLPPEDTRAACIAPEHFAFLISEPSEEPHQMIATARMALLKEFDTPDTYAAEALSRVYLYLGFGAEARQVIDDFLPKAEVAPLYRALAAGLDDTPDLAGQALSGQVGCPGPASFWAMMVGPVPAALNERTQRDVAATASDLPLHLRRLLVPRLAQHLLARGHDQLAAALRDSLARVDGAHGASYQMLQAALAEEGDIASGGDGAPSPASSTAAEAILEKVAESNKVEAAQALVELIRLANAQGRPLPPDKIDLAEALIFEHRDTDVARVLLIGLAPAYARDGAFSKAFDRLDAAAALPTEAVPDPLDRARSTTALLLAQNAADEIFLRTLFHPAHAGLGATVSPEASFAIAERLLALGFPEQALAQSESLPREDAYRLMRVRALAALGRYERALASLAGLRGAESDALRGELLARLGEHERAHTMSRVAGDEEAARRAAWASGSAEAIRESGSETEAGFTEATRPETAPTAPGRPSLSGAEELLEQIRQRRSAIETLLEEKSTATGAATRSTTPAGEGAENPPGA